eukprot:TRINITY_DN13864_c0_g1_i4.p1 TRINITY_DN13864_c0_g1~~TRINITY_DN13864_c0_g1_i4.p1  ORF type:complete len:345 (+),score=51.30 TRINITY_DN13864_c0_g1_i4:261-1295(+)
MQAVQPWQFKFKYMPKLYGDVNLKRPREYWDYECVNLVYGDEQNYQVIRKIGRGKYSEVFEGINLLNNSKCVVKVLKPIKAKKIFREVKILQNLCGGPNIINLYDIVRSDQQSQTTSLIFEYVDNIDHRVLYPKLTDFDIRFYMYQLLKTLDFTHSQGIIHRDIKPHNVMIDHNKKYLRVIDWGLAEFFIPGKELNVRVASRYYKGPELLIDFQYYDYSLDIWSAGCMLAQLVFMIDTMFRGSSNEDQLEQISKVLGSDDLEAYIDKYDCTLDSAYENVLNKHQQKPWKSFITDENKHLTSDDALDLISKMLVYDHSERITPTQALKHPYFYPVLNSFEKEKKK